MACALLPAAAAAAAAHPSRPSARRSAAVPKGYPNQVVCMNQLRQLHWKLPFTAAEPHRSRSLVGCCTCSSSSTEAATSGRFADVSSGHKDVPVRYLVDVVPGTHIVISGYWIGPDEDDGCGHIQAILQRIS